MRVVFDLDGTLADLQHRLHFIQGPGKKDYDRFFRACAQDKPIAALCAVYRALHSQGHRLEVWTGRSEMVRDQTYWWFNSHRLPLPRVLKMRPVKNHVPDTVLKEGWLTDDFKTEAMNIDLVFEDRARVVDMWRSYGIRTAQVAKGDF